MFSQFKKMETTMKLALVIVIFCSIQTIYSEDDMEGFGEKCEDGGLFVHRCLDGHCCRIGDTWYCKETALHPFDDDYSACEERAPRYNPTPSTTTVDYRKLKNLTDKPMVKPKIKATVKPIVNIYGHQDQTLHVDGSSDFDNSNADFFNNNNDVDDNDSDESTSNKITPKGFPPLAIIGIIGLSVTCVVVVVIVLYLKRQRLASSGFGYVIQQNVI